MYKDKKMQIQTRFWYRSSLFCVDFVAELHIHVLLRLNLTYTKVAATNVHKNTLWHNTNVSTANKKCSQFYFVMIFYSVDKNHQTKSNVHIIYFRFRLGQFPIVLSSIAVSSPPAWLCTCCNSDTIDDEVELKFFHVFSMFSIASRMTSALYEKTMWNFCEISWEFWPLLNSTFQVPGSL